MSEYFLLGSKKFVSENPEVFYRHKDDKELWGTAWNNERSCAPCPAVHPLLPNSDHKVEMTEQWQYYIRAINWNMATWYVSALFGAKKAFTNRPENDVRADWLMRKDLTRPNPDQDRVRSCSRSPVSVSHIVDGVAILDMMDGTKPPRLKSGFNYPSNVFNINPDAYFYHPRTHHKMFLVATITSGTGRTRPFPNGAVYNWKQDGQPYVFWPYVSNRPIVYSIDNLVEVTGITNPYT
jgi:hypothetical protein